MKGLKNWRYADAADLISHFGFSFIKYKNGSHEIWSNGEVEVELYYRNNQRRYNKGGIAKICKRTGIPLEVMRTWTDISKAKKKEIRDAHKRVEP